MDADASEPETGPSAANGSTTFDDESGCAAPEPTRLTAALRVANSRGLCCHSYVRTVRPRPGQGTTLVPAHSKPHIKKTSTHPSEATYPCCIPALGELGDIAPRGGWG